MEFQFIAQEIRQCDENENKNNLENLEVELIFRYKFTESFMGDLFEFSKIHQYDDRETFKEAWTNWIAENEEVVMKETTRLITLGYDGDIQEKMFKSARYYFRKKSIETKIPQQRRKYIGVTKELLTAMDTHIRENITKSNYKPKDGFVEFCLSHTAILKESVAKICNDKTMESDAKTIENKMKKTYKNRYFRLNNAKMVEPNESR